MNGGVHGPGQRLVLVFVVIALVKYLKSGK
jgi:hypothetical protein